MGLFELVLVMAAVMVVVLVMALNRAATVMWRRRKRIKRRGGWRCGRCRTGGGPFSYA